MLTILCLLIDTIHMDQGMNITRGPFKSMQSDVPLFSFIKICSMIYLR